MLTGVSRQCCVAADRNRLVEAKSREAAQRAPNSLPSRASGARRGALMSCSGVAEMQILEAKAMESGCLSARSFFPPWCGRMCVRSLVDRKSFVIPNWAKFALTAVKAVKITGVIRLKVCANPKEVSEETVKRSV
eukprot:1711784-Rhodomonas_salina.1